MNFSPAAFAWLWWVKLGRALWEDMARAGKLKSNLAQGVPGINEHPLLRELQGWKAADIPGTGKGRGAGRIIYRDAGNGLIEIKGFVKGHDYTKILGQ